MPVDVAVTIERDDWTKALGDIEARAAKVVGLTLGRACPGLDTAEVSFLFADDATLQTLNRTWRDKDAPTNVLSFPTRSLRIGEVPVAAFPGTPLELGDVALAFETIAREAEAQGKTLADHLDHLIVHGTLHLLGHDHETDEEAALMEGLEVAILDSLGVADPYAPEREHG